MYKNSNNSLAHRQELKYRILRIAMPLFKQKGIKAIRMDDIANALSISKRTLYEIYENKEDLLLECVKMDSDNLSKRILDYSMTAENELDIVVTYFRYKFADLDSLSTAFLTELKKYDKVTEFLAEQCKEQQERSSQFMRKCIENGFFVPNLNYNIIQDLCDSLMSSGIPFSLGQKYTLREIFYNFFIVLLRGFCTEKGLTLLDQYLKKTPL